MLRHEQWADNAIKHIERVRAAYTRMAGALQPANSNAVPVPTAGGQQQAAPQVSVDTIVSAVVREVKNESIAGVRLSLAIANTAKRNAMRAV